MAKVNPRSVPATKAAVDKAFQRGTDEACRTLMRITAFTLCDRDMMPTDKIQEFIFAVQDYCMEISAGRLTIMDIAEALHDEYKLKFSDDEEFKKQYGQNKQSYKR